MNDENVILAYKLNKNQIELLEIAGKRINKNIIVKNTDIPQDIVAVPSFMCFVNIDNEIEENKKFVLKNVDDVKDYITCIVIDKNTFTDIEQLQNEMQRALKKYADNERTIESDSIKYLQKIKEYQKDHNIGENDFDFSEFDMVTYFDDSRIETMRCIINNVKYEVIYNTELAKYIDFDNKKILPISYNTITKKFFEIMMNITTFLKTNLNYADENGINPRKLEIEQLTKLCNIIAEEIYIDKFDVNIGSNRIEQLIIKGNDTNVTDKHLIACRLSKEEIIVNWLPYIKQIIKIHLENTNTTIREDNLFIYNFDEELWADIRKFIKWFVALPLWKNRDIEFVSKIFAGTSPKSHWKEIFETGKTEDNIQVLERPINVIEILGGINE